MEDGDGQESLGGRDRKKTSKKKKSKKNKSDGPNTDLNEDKKAFGYLDLSADDVSQTKEAPRCQWATIYCPATNKDDPTSVVPTIFHEVCLSMYKLDKSATFMPVEEELDMPELHQDSDRVEDI